MTVLQRTKNLLAGGFRGTRLDLQNELGCGAAQLSKALRHLGANVQLGGAPKDDIYWLGTKKRKAKNR